MGDRKVLAVLSIGPAYFGWNREDEKTEAGGQIIELHDGRALKARKEACSP